MILVYGGSLVIGGLVAGAIGYLAWLTIKDMQDAGWL